jgi:glycerate kinase
MIKKVVIVPDSFKETMSSITVCDIIEKAIHGVNGKIETVKIPIADGGEGTVDAFLEAGGGKKISCRVSGPYGEQIDSFYGILADGTTAVVEMAAAAGLPLVGERKDPSHTTTYGVGQLMADALDRGCKKIIAGIGGSATTDAGIGMAAALGVRFLDRDGKEIPLTGAGLALLERIDLSERDSRLDMVDISVACDVDNPLFGAHGAAYVYSPQKGADRDMVEQLDSNLRHFAEIVRSQLGIDVQDIPGAGAAGGLGAGLVVFTGATLQSGIDTVLDAARFSEVIESADLIITGEGKIDGQSVRGKVPVGVARRATHLCRAPVIALVGDIGDDIERVYDYGITAVFSINHRAIPFSEARQRAPQDLFSTAQSVMRFAQSLGLTQE